MDNIRYMLRIKKPKSHKIIIYILGISLLFIIIFYIINNSKSNYEINSQDWALNNYGQSVGTSTGIKGLDINIVNSWKITKGNKNIIVGIVDSGVDYSLDTLKENILYNDNDLIDGVDNDNNGYIDDYLGWDFYNFDNEIYDNYNYDYHGTYISTTILKVAPQIKILPVKFLKSTTGSAKDATSAIKYAIERGARIINCSWSFNNYDNELYEVIKNNPNILFVCAAGNGNFNLDEHIIYPNSFNLSNIITVMAIANNGEIYNASGYGSKVDIAAPGVNVLVEFPEGDMTLIDGTSVATAFVSSAASLILSVDDKLTPNEVKDIIIKSSRRLDTLKSKCNSEGLLDIYKSLVNYDY